VNQSEGAPGTSDDAATEPVAPVGVAIVSWNVRLLLRACLRSLFEGENPADLRVVVVDNASDDGTVAMLHSEFPDVAVVANATNRGFTKGNNQALSALGLWRDDFATPPFVLLLNPDTEAQPGAVAEMAAHLRDHPGAAAVGPMLRYGDGEIQRSRRRFPTLATGLLESTPVAWHWPHNPASRRFHMDDVPPDVPGVVDWVTGAAILLRTTALEDVGGFDEGFFMYSEELDLCRRLRDAGWEVRYHPAAVVIHHEGRSSEQAVPARHLQFARSRVRFFRKHHGRLSAAVVRGGLLLGYSVELVIEGAKWLVGHRRPLRRDRIHAYVGVLRDGLG
jgi:GT2 family glycosyltransferase